jgi:DNA-binding transcriptional ArsR family regulator
MQDSYKTLSASTLAMIAERFRMLGDASRLRLLQALADREMSVGELVEATQTAQASVSKQLQLLLRAGFVERRRQGLHVYYRIADPNVFKLCDAVCGSLTEQLQRDLSSLQGSATPDKRPGRRKRTA